MSDVPPAATTVYWKVMELVETKVMVPDKLRVPPTGWLKKSNVFAVVGAPTITTLPPNPPGLVITALTGVVED